MAKKNITQTGISGLRGVNYPSNWSREQVAEAEAYVQQIQRDAEKLRHGVNPYVRTPVVGTSEPLTYEVGTPGREVGKSRYDRGNILDPVTSFEDLNQRRYDEQPWWDVAANGIAKATGRAATSFLTGVLGSVAGAADFLYEGIKNDNWRASAFFDNPFTNALADIDEWADSTFTNYKSIVQQQNEMNGEWYKNLGGLNMIMDDIVTNFGFIVGMGAAAAATGGVGGAIAGAARRGITSAVLRNTMGSISKGLNAARIADKYGKQITQGLTLINSSAGEAALEGLTTKREMIKTETERIDNTIDQHISEDPNIQALDNSYEQQLRNLENQYFLRPKDEAYAQQKEALTQQYQQQRKAMSEQWEQRRQEAYKELEDGAEQAGTATALLNMAILIPSNFNMYGRLINRSFRSAEKSAGHSWASRFSEIHRRNALGQKNITGGLGEKSYKAIREGGDQYGSRSFVGNASKRLASTFFSEGVYEEMGQSTVSTGAQYYHEWTDPDNYWRARLDPDSIDKFTEGSHDFLTALGQGFKQTYGNIDGWREGFIGAISGGLFGMSELREEWRDTKFAKKTAKELNKQLSSDRLPNLLQHIIAQASHDTNKEAFAAMGNQRDWKTEDDKATYALISSFARAGRMEDLYHLLNTYADGMTDEEIADLVEKSSREVTTDEQIRRARAQLSSNLQSEVSKHLLDGASASEAMHARTRVREAKEKENQTRQAASSVLGDIATDPRKRRDLERVARRGRDPEKREAARTVKAAIAERELAERDYNRMLASPTSAQSIEDLINDYNAQWDDVPNNVGEAYWEGDFVDRQGNKMDANTIRNQVAHNTQRMHEVVDRYKKAVEKVNKDSRGILSKDQEDYLAFTKFMADSSGVRANELVEKWRGVLPEYISVRHKSAKAAAKWFGIDEGEVTEDPERPGYFRVSTKKMTDGQFSNFILHGLLRQSHILDKNDKGDGVENEKTRSALADEALNAVDQEMKRRGRREGFDREELRKDFEDIEDHLKKNRAFLEAYADAMANPENVMSAKDRWMRKLKKKYDQTKVKLRQAKMSIQELGDLEDEDLKSLDAYHYGLAKAEKIRRRITAYWRSNVPDMYDRVEEAFKDIQDPEVRQEVINRVKKAIDDIVDRFNNKDDSNAAQSVTPEDVSMMISLDEIIPEDDPLWNKIDKKTRKAIEDGLKDIEKSLMRLIDKFKGFIKSVGEFFDNLRSSRKETPVDENSSSDSILNHVRTLLNKARFNSGDIDRLEQIKDVLEKKISKLEQSNSALAKRAAKALRNALKNVVDAINDFMRGNKSDTEPVNMPPHGPVNPRGATRSKKTDEKNDIAGTPDTAHLQNPSAEEEEACMNDATNSVLFIDDNGSPGTNIWQSVTGEFSRRSGFTYRPYHEIVLKAIEGKADDETVHIPEIGEHGNDKTAAEWRRYANHSKAVHDFLSSKKAFGYIDSGKIQSRSEIGFLITKQNGETIIYLVHDGQVISDLNDPAYGAADPDGSLKAFREVLEKEYDESKIDDSLGGVMSKYKTHASSVFAGFPKFAEKDSEGEVPTRTVASFGKDAQGITFMVNRDKGVEDTNGEMVVGSGRVGQPFMLIPTPGNRGMTRKRAVPVSTKPMTKDGIEMKVIVAAALKLSKDRNRLLTLKDFLRNFLNCRNVFITVGERSVLIPETMQSETRNVITIDVRTRNMDNGSPITSTITIDAESGEVISITSPNALRANVSYNLLTDDSAPYSYKNVLRGITGLPKTYTDFLKKICYTKLSDLKTHNSWITLNKLRVDKTGNVTEEEVAPVTSGVMFKSAENVTVAVREPYTGETFFVTINESSDDGVYKIASIRRSVNGKPFEFIDMTNGTQERLKPLIARAIISKDSAKIEMGSTYRFNINGIIYEFTAKETGTPEVIYSENKQIRSQALNRQFSSAMVSIASSMTDTSTLDSVIKTWFYPGTIDASPELRDALEKVITAIKNGDPTPEMSNSVKAKLLNARRPTPESTRRSKLVKALVDRLRSHNIKVNLDPEEGQRKLNEIQRRLNDGEKPGSLQQELGVRFFISSDGKKVYGFADDRDGIYLDPDLATPETLIHEYTHLWAHLLRNSKDPKHKAMWKELVNEMKRLQHMWDTIKEKYTWLKTDDEIADEVFARISGSDGQEWFMNNIGNQLDSNADANKIFDKLRSLLEKLLNFVKGIFNVPVTAKSLKELVWQDMLSENPLGNFGVQEEMSTEPELELAKKDEVKETEYKLSDVIDPAEDEDFIIMQLESMGITVDTRADGNFVKIGTVTTELANLLPGINKSSMMIDLSEPEDTIIGNMSRLKVRDPSFKGITPVLENTSVYFVRGYIRPDDFLSLIETLLTTNERMLLWNAAKNYQVTKDMEPYQIVAVAAHAFNRYLQEGATGSEDMDTICRIIKESMDSAETRIDELTAAEQTLTMDASPEIPTDPISSLSYNDRKKLRSATLDKLTSRDLKFLKEAGYSADFYHKQTDKIKEWMHECVL